MNKIFTLICAILLILSCSGTQPTSGELATIERLAKAIKTAEPHEVQNCANLGKLGAYSDSGIVNCKAAVRRLAAEKGATHIVWMTAVPHGFLGESYASGIAYKCE